MLGIAVTLRNVPVPVAVAVAVFGCHSTKPKIWRKCWRTEAYKKRRHSLSTRRCVCCAVLRCDVL